MIGLGYVESELPESIRNVDVHVDAAGQRHLGQHLSNF